RAEVIDDAVTALALLRQQPDVDPASVFLLGHSLGGCLAPAIAKEDGKLKGVILLSGTIRPMKDVIVDQLTYLASLPGDEQAARQKALDQVKAKTDPSATSRPDRLLGAPIAYWDDLDSYLGPHGQDLARSMSGRVLVLGGGRDYQVTRKDFDLWQSTLKGRPNVTFEWLPNVNHLFATGEGMATDKEYEKSQNVDGAVVAGIANWIRTGEYAP